MRLAIQIFGLLLVAGIQITLWPQLSDRLLPAWMLVVALAWGFARGDLPGFRLAFAGGLLLDLYAREHFGMLTLAMSLSYGAVFIILRSQLGQPGLVLKYSLVVVSAALYELIILIWLAATVGRFPFFAQLLHVATLNIVSTVIVFIIMEPVIRAIARRLEPKHPAHEARSL